MNDLVKFLQSVSTLPKDTTAIDAADLFDADGVALPMPAAFWEAKTREEKMLFGHTFGLYAFPTNEIIQTLGLIIAGRPAVEIGAGNGGFAKALGIPATDNHQQLMPQFAKLYELAGQPVVNYGPHVERLEATLAVAKYTPKVVVACWVTHLYNPLRHELGGNVIGVDEQNIMEAVDEYIFIGNTHIHGSKPLLQDLNAGKITTHYVSEFYVDDPMIQSRSSRGHDFLIRLVRK